MEIRYRRANIEDLDALFEVRSRTRDNLVCQNKKVQGSLYSDHNGFVFKSLQ